MPIAWHNYEVTIEDVAFNGNDVIVCSAFQVACPQIKYKYKIQIHCGHDMIGYSVHLLCHKCVYFPIHNYM